MYCVPCLLLGILRRYGLVCLMKQYVDEFSDFLPQLEYFKYILSSSCTVNEEVKDWKKFMPLSLTPMPASMRPGNFLSSFDQMTSASAMRRTGAIRSKLPMDHMTHNGRDQRQYNLASDISETLACVANDASLLYPS